MDNPNITMYEYIRIQEEKALSRGETFNWKTATYGKTEYCEDEDDCFTNFETKFPAIILDNTLTSDAAISCGPTISPLNDNEIDFRISFDDLYDEEYRVRHPTYRETPSSPGTLPVKSVVLGTLLDPFQFPYPKRRLTMEEIVNKFIEEGKREHEKMDAFIIEFRTTNELLLKERNNSLSELEFKIYGLSWEKEEAQQRKFLENLKQLHINIPFTEALAQMPKYAKFLKGLLSNKARLEEACTVTMNERCSAVLLNKLPSKEKDPGSFTIPLRGTKTNKNELGTSRQIHPGWKRGSVFDVDQSMKKPRTEDDECYGIDDLDAVIQSTAQELLENDNLEDDNNRPDFENRGPNSEIPIRHIDPIKTPYPQKTQEQEEMLSEHLYSASAIEIDEKKPELKD
ncbi:hypothetical protein Tco_0344709 [Tanacetum coccineum]